MASIQRLMLIGGSGQVGQALRAASLPPRFELLTPGHAQCDLTNHRQVQQVVNELKPDVIINAAAITNVDLCEKEQDHAVALNFEGPANLAAQCSMLDIPLIHLSTDFVFDGKDGATPYTTESPMNPLNVYGNTKMMGEESVRHELAWHVILRISSVFSQFGNNLLTRITKAADENGALYTSDAVSTPTYAVDIAEALLAMADQILKGKTDGFGTFHLCGDPPATRQEFIETVLAAYAPTAKVEFKTPTANAAPRPAYSALDCQKTTRLYGIKPRSWRDGITASLTQLQQSAHA